MKNNLKNTISKKPTVTLFVSAFNEEKNIKTFLKSILSQKETNYELNRIIVVSDGSTDKTVSRVKKLNSKKIKIKDYKKRIGKSSRLNEVYRSFTTDFLIQSDADVIFEDNLVIANMIKAITMDKNIGLCGGNPIAIKGATFTEKAINVTHNVYRKFRTEVKDGNNVFSSDGRLLALSKPFARKLYIPNTMIANDMFAYFSCISNGYTYRFVKDAVVYYRSPQTLKDHIKQNVRFEAGPIRMGKYFKNGIIETERKVPKHVYFKYVLIEFLKHPTLSIYIYLINTYCKILARQKESSITALWQIAQSTKKI